MKRIKITKSLDTKVVSFCNSMFDTRRSIGKKLFKKPIDELRTLLAGYTIGTDEYTYIEKIISDYPKLLCIKPSKFNEKIGEFERILKISSDKKSPTYAFSKKIVKALRYDAYRDLEYPRFIDSLGWSLRVCFYCNYAGTLNLSQNKKISTYYDLDHILPKSIYPFFATSFYNFIPSCATCNRKKSNSVIKGLNPFYEEKGSHTVNQIFSLDRKLYPLYLADNDLKHLKINVSSDVNSIVLKDYKKIVDLETLYSSQKMVVEEIIWKKRIYTDEYIKDLVSIKGLDLGKKEIIRMLWGNDLDESTLNDRPLSKLIQDIYKDLEILPKK